MRSGLLFCQQSYSQVASPVSVDVVAASCVVCWRESRLIHWVSCAAASAYTSGSSQGGALTAPRCVLLASSPVWPVPWKVAIDFPKLPSARHASITPLCPYL